MSLLDVVSNVLSSASAGDIKGSMDQAIYGVQDELGKFLSSGKTILDIKAQAQPYLQSANGDAASRAQAIIVKADSLLANIQTIQGQAMQTMSEASTLRGQMESDPTWKNILVADWSSLGWETIKQARLMIGQATGIISDLAGETKQMEDHMSQVNALQSDVSTLDDIAQGKGFRGTLSSFESGLSSAAAGVGKTAQNTVYIVAGIAAAVFLLPQIMSGAALGAKKSYKVLRSNPRRRRR